VCVCVCDCERDAEKSVVWRFRVGLSLRWKRQDKREKVVSFLYSKTRGPKKRCPAALGQPAREGKRSGFVVY
jgi:hypothetical protein